MTENELVERIALMLREAGYTTETIFDNNIFHKVACMVAKQEREYRGETAE